MALKNKSKKTKSVVKVKDLARKIGLPLNKTVESLKELGLKIKSATSEIEQSLVGIAEEHLRDIAGKTPPPAAAAASVKEGSENDAVHIKPPIVVKALAEALDKKPNEIVTALMSFNVLASINQVVDHDVAKKICRKFGRTLVLDKREKDEHVKTAEAVEEEHRLSEKTEAQDLPENLVERPPVVTFLGHVDHGKTSLQDAVRKTNVVEGEAGGITQHIGSSVVEYKGKKITFIDTPGHEAFTAMRARGAKVTDIAVLVVAADDGFMPQTIEAYTHIKAAKVPVIIALNKMDLPSADPEKVLRQMQQYEMLSEDWGGETAVVRVSAVTGAGIDELLDRIVLESEMLQLKANPGRPAKGVVIEAQLEQGQGPTVNVLVQNGTLRRGDFVLCGEFYGKVKALIGAKGEKLDEVGPSMPAKLVGLSGVPQAGTKLAVCSDEKEAKKIAEERADSTKRGQLEKGTGPATNLEDLMSRYAESQKKSLKIIVKADVQGSVEAIKESLLKFPKDKILMDVISATTGAITENDVLLASASAAIIIGFHIRVNPGVNNLAKKEGVEIRLYSIIYELIEDIKDALEGRLAPESREKELGNATILKIFAITKGPKICGCMVESGLVKVGTKARVFRENELIYNGSVQSLRRFQDDVKEVRQGLECGIRLDNFVDFQEGDKIQLYEVEMKKATL